MQQTFYSRFRRLSGAFMLSRSERNFGGIERIQFIQWLLVISNTNTLYKWLCWYMKYLHFPSITKAPNLTLSVNTGANILATLSNFCHPSETTTEIECISLNHASLYQAGVLFIQLIIVMGTMASPLPSSVKLPKSAQRLASLMLCPYYSLISS